MNTQVMYKGTENIPFKRLHDAGVGLENMIWISKSGFGYANQSFEHRLCDGQSKPVISIRYYPIQGCVRPKQTVFCDVTCLQKSYM